MSTQTRFPRGLYGITPEWDDTRRLLAAVSAAAQGGMAALQWRRKTAPDGQRLPQALALAEHCKTLGIVFIVNDDYPLALAVDADGVHLGREDGDPAEARKALGPKKIIGCSCYNDLALAQHALDQDVDYIAFGALYPSTVKPEAARATLDHLRQARALVSRSDASPRVAIVAIGGLTPDNAAPVVDAGADSIALISGLFGAADIQLAAQRCEALFTHPA